MIILSLALIADWYVGDPDTLWRRVPHPVVLFGKVIDIFDSHRRAHKDQDLFYGILLLLVFFILSAMCLVIGVLCLVSFRYVPRIFPNFFVFSPA